MNERRVWIAGGLAVLAVLVIGRIDLRHTESKVPPFPPQGQSTLPRYEEIKRLDEDFDRRAWLYGGVAAVAMGIATAVALARSPTLEGQRRVFSEAGVAGVVLGLVGVVLLWTLRSNIDPPTGAVFAPCLMLLAVAALGGGAARIQRPPAEEVAALHAREFKRVAVAAVSSTALTVLLAWVFAAPQNGSCVDASSAPDWTSPIGWTAVISAVAAIILGLAGLAARRWFVALICIVVNPAALLYMVLSTGALCG
jgi:hypothetical protein